MNMTTSVDRLPRRTADPNTSRRSVSKKCNAESKQIIVVGPEFGEFLLYIDKKIIASVRTGSVEAVAPKWRGYPPRRNNDIIWLCIRHVVRVSSGPIGGGLIKILSDFDRTGLDVSPTYASGD